MVPQLLRWLTKRGNESAENADSIPRTAEEAVSRAKEQRSGSAQETAEQKQSPPKLSPRG